jgi:GntR family transcriptional regulator, transcriptional repressor for pyruvate dehydrogenase complex
MGGRKPAVFDRIEQAPNLTAGLVDTLVSQIESGELTPGQRLPTEQAIVAATGVSRTVVREALASLRARGLITTRQGLGAFVTESATPRSFSMDSKLGLIEGLQVFELRLGIEAEAASLAAVRRTEEDLSRLRTALAAISDAILASRSGAEEDFTFHRTMLLAAHNPYFSRVFDVVGSAIIPQRRLRLDEMTERERGLYMRRLHGEHEAIVTAIARGDAKAARAASRSHLRKSHARLQKLGL